MKRVLVRLLLCMAILPVMTHAAVDDLYLKRGDTKPAYPVVVRDRQGVVDLTGCTITATMENWSSGVNVFSGVTITVTSAVDGEAEYRWLEADTNTTGAFAIEFKVLDVDGKVFTVPAGYKAKVYILERY